jgi:hypothetical protein
MQFALGIMFRNGNLHVNIDNDMNIREMFLGVIITEVDAGWRKRRARRVTSK